MEGFSKPILKAYNLPSYRLENYYDLVPNFKSESGF